MPGPAGPRRSRWTPRRVTHRARRLRAQRLTGAGFARPEDVVGWLGAVQAQDYGPAKWSLGARVAGATDAQVERAFAAGAILRTHVLRPTWHFVLPADIRWLLTATAPRVRARDARRYAQLGLDGDTLRRSAAALVAALRGGNQLTRREAAAVLTAAGIGVEGQRLPYLLMAAELDALICSGPRRGKQHTYMLLEERAPDARDLPRHEALAELARRFFAGHGPATARDFAIWATLTLAEARAAIEAAGPELRAEDLGGLRFWASATGTGERGRAPRGAAATAGPPRPGLRRDRHGLHRDQAAAGPARLALGAGDAAGLPARRPAGRRRRRVLAPAPEEGSRDRRGRPAGDVRRSPPRRRSRPRPRATARSWVCPRT